MSEQRRAKDWNCPSCNTKLGEVLYGQLYINGATELNTDNANLVVKCPNCEYRKIWYAYDRLSMFINEIAAQVVRSLKS